MRTPEPMDAKQAIEDCPARMSSTPSSRKEYTAPRLVVYGKLSDLTRAVGNDAFDGLIGSSSTS